MEGDKKFWKFRFLFLGVSVFDWFLPQRMGSFYSRLWRLWPCLCSKQASVKGPALSAGFPIEWDPIIEAGSKRFLFQGITTMVNRDFVWKFGWFCWFFSVFVWKCLDFDVFLQVICAAGGRHEAHLVLRSPVNPVRDALWQDRSK